MRTSYSVVYFAQVSDMVSTEEQEQMASRIVIVDNANELPDTCLNGHRTVYSSDSADGVIILKCHGCRDKSIVVYGWLADRVARLILGGKRTEFH